MKNKLGGILEAILLFILYLFLWTIFHNYFSSKFPLEAKISSVGDLWLKNNTIQNLLNDINFWSTSLGICLYIIIEITIVSSIIFLFSKLLKFENTFSKSVIIVLFAHSIFLVQHVFECLFVIKNTSYFISVNREDFSFLSISYFFQLFNLHFNKSLKYLFQTLGIFEIIYWILLIYFSKKTIKVSWKNAILLVFISYIPLLILWLFVITFLALMNS